MAESPSYLGKCLKEHMLLNEQVSNWKPHILKVLHHRMICTAVQTLGCSRRVDVAWMPHGYIKDEKFISIQSTFAPGSDRDLVLSEQKLKWWDQTPKGLFHGSNQGNVFSPQRPAPQCLTLRPSHQSEALLGTAFQAGHRCRSDLTGLTLLVQ